jgi:misacylated tRNA(Ala) deacylase
VPRGQQLAYEDAYARSIEARVLAVEAGDTISVLLDRTVFYPGGGGQPSDSGTLRRADDGQSWHVASARKSDGEIAHVLDGSDEPPSVGDEIEASIDWPRRHLLMRTHTALHVLCGVVWRDWGA